MALTVDFEFVYASLLHRNPFLTLETVSVELLSKETPLTTLKARHLRISTDTILIAPVSSHTTVTCHYYHELRYLIVNYQLHKKIILRRANQTWNNQSRRNTNSCRNRQHNTRFNTTTSGPTIETHVAYDLIAIFSQVYLNNLKQAITLVHSGKSGIATLPSSILIQPVITI